MNYRSALMIVVVIGLPLSIPISSAQTTPLGFAQRQDVGREIQLQPNQRAAIEALGPICDAQCQAYVSQNFGEISDDARLAFGALPAETREQIVSDQDAEVRTDVEINAIDDVLANPQMDRFRQLWTQFQGASGLTTGFVSEAMNLSDDQLNELTDLQATAGELTNLCLSSPSLTADQQTIIIQNINNGVIDQSINILENAQLDILVNLGGDPFEFDPTEDDGLTDTPADPDAAPTDQENADPVSPEIDADPNEPARQPEPNQTGSDTRIASGSQNRNQTGSNSRNALGTQVRSQAGSSSRNTSGTRARNQAGSGSRSAGNTVRQSRASNQNTRRPNQANSSGRSSRNSNRASQSNRRTRQPSSRGARQPSSSRARQPSSRGARQPSSRSGNSSGSGRRG